MALNIKNPETEKLAQKLARITGKSKTAAITEALRAYLESLAPDPGDELAQRLLRIGKQCAAHLREPYRSVEHGDLLYDEKGMPK